MITARVNCSWCLDAKLVKVSRTQTRPCLNCNPDHHQHPEHWKQSEMFRRAVRFERPWRSNAERHNAARAHRALVGAP